MDYQLIRPLVIDRVVVKAKKMKKEGSVKDEIEKLEPEDGEKLGEIVEEERGEVKGEDVVEES